MMDPRTCEQLDACRPGRADWEDDELAQLAEELRNNRELRELAARLEDLDQAIAAALIDVTPPPGLAQRIMARIDQAHPQIAAAPTAAAAPVPPAKTAAQLAAPLIAGLSGTEATETPAAASPAPARAGRWSRRNWIVVATSTAILAATVALMFLPGGPVRLGPEEIITAVDRLYVQDFRQDEGWEVAPADGTPEVPRDVLARAVAWRTAHVAGASAYVYDIQNARGKRAVLVAVVCQGNRVPTAPPSQPQSSSGRMIAVWQSPQQHLTYVLVVEGSLADYRSFVALGRSLT